MAGTEHGAGGRGGRLLGTLGLVAATALWGAAIWLTLYRPDLLAPFGAPARLAVIAVAWAVPLLLTLLALAALRRARQTLDEARALHAETDAMAQRLRAAREAAARAERSARPPTERADAAGAAGPGPAGAPAQEPARTRATSRTSDPEDEARDEEPADGGTDTSRELAWSALDFPRSEADTAGFEALRRVLAEDPKLAAVIRSAQHVLSLLAQEGVHLDSEGAPPPPPEALRRYVEGQRGAAIAGLWSVDDRERLSLAVGRLRRDPAFRSAAHRFVAAFDIWLADVVAEADDTALARIAASRSGRAFRLLGRVTGSFG